MLTLMEILSNQDRNDGMMKYSSVLLAGGPIHRLEGLLQKKIIQHLYNIGGVKLLGY